MTIGLIILMILFGLLLLILEILIIPGLIAGIAGVLIMLAGMYWMYKDYGSVAGHITAAATAIVTASAIFYCLKTKAWERFSLKEKLVGKSVTTDDLQVKEGDEAIAVSALRPMGTVMIGDQKAEAQTNGELVQAGTTVIVVKILSNKLIVKPKN